MSKRGNSEGSLYETDEGWRGYVWCRRPDSTRYRKYVRGATFAEAQHNWLKLRDRAQHGPVSSDVPKLADFLIYWLQEVVLPNLAPKTYEKYEMFSRLYIVPYLGSKRIDKLTVKDIRQWLNKLAITCQCCVQEKDAHRAEVKRRCCAVGKCCGGVLGASTCKGARDALRTALGYAIEDETITRNPAAGKGLTPPKHAGKRNRRRKSWSVEDARWFLESAWHCGEALYAAFVLVLVLGLRKGEVLGLGWDQVDLDAAQLYIEDQLQRARHQLVLREVKTEASEGPLPLPGICVMALKIRRKRQDADRDRAAGEWIDNGLVFTTRYGTPIEPRNFNRSFDRCIIAAKVPRITVHGTRKTCGSLLAALEVHPRVAMQILRHSKIAVTMEIYTEVPTDATREALRKLGDWLDQ
jgi:integrase